MQWYSLGVRECLMQKNVQKTQGEEVDKLGEKNQKGKKSIRKNMQKSGRYFHLLPIYRQVVLAMPVYECGANCNSSIILDSKQYMLHLSNVPLIFCKFEFPSNKIQVLCQNFHQCMQVGQCKHFSDVKQTGQNLSSETCQWHKYLM